MDKFDMPDSVFIDDNNGRIAELENKVARLERKVSLLASIAEKTVQLVRKE